MYDTEKKYIYGVMSARKQFLGASILPQTVSFVRRYYHKLKTKMRFTQKMVKLRVIYFKCMN